MGGAYLQSTQLSGQDVLAFYLLLLFIMFAMQVRTYYYDIKTINTASNQTHTGLQIEDTTHKDKGARLQTYKLFLVQVGSGMQSSQRKPMSFA